MKRIVWTYGLISGIIVSVWMLISVAIGCEQMDTDWGMFLGFTTMIMAFSFIFVAIKNYRDLHNNGTISFGKAFKIGLYISLIASSIYVISWVIDYYMFYPDFMEKYATHVINKLQTNGAAAAEIEAKRTEMASVKEMYKNPILLILLTYTEILPVGLIISLFTAFFLKRKSKEKK